MTIGLSTVSKCFLATFFLFFGIEAIAKRNLGIFRIEEWRMVELTFHSESKYDDPFNDVVLDAIFEGPGGIQMIRPAFWDGGNTWKVRFAPPKRGVWKMTTISNKINDRGLHSAKAKIRCKKYNGNLDIYRHGFVKVSDNGRYLVYDDGTPFFYLGDTHWCFVHERYDTSNIEGIESQFKYVVDKRVDQGFTVFQSEAIQNFDDTESDYVDEESRCSFNNGFGEDDLPGLKNLDRKFSYIASKGLLHANSQICWATEPRVYSKVYTRDYMYKLGRYWSARFGAYPVLWTVAQEVDNDLYGGLSDKDVELWKQMAKGLTGNDCYRHPLSAHMEEVSNTDATKSSWGDLKYHTWWAIQWRDSMNNPIRIKTFWNYDVTKPCILYESGYEDIAVSANVALRQGFLGFQSGLFGYGYGANGIWNDLYDKDDMASIYYMPQHFIQWYSGANLEGADLLSNLKSFYQAIKWWELEPRFDDMNWGEFSRTCNYALSSINNTLYIVYLWKESNVPDGKLKKIKINVPYRAKWYNPREGVYHIVGECYSKDGEYILPPRPTCDDWVFVFEEISK